MKAKSIKANSPPEFRAALAAGKKDGFLPTLAFIVISNIADVNDLSVAMTEEGIAVFGVSTSEKFTESGMESASIVALLSDMNPDYFKIVLEKYNSPSPYEAASQAAAIGLSYFKNPGFIITSANGRMSGEDIIRGLTDIAGHDAVIMGGIAGNPADFSGTIFTNEASGTGGLLSLIIDQDKIELKGMAISGWKPAGTEKIVTKGEGSWIYSIDDEPAMKVIQRFLGTDIAINQETEGMNPLDAGYPLQFKRASGTPSMRPVLLWNPADQSVMVGGEIKQGETFRFSLPPDFDVVDTVVESTKILKQKEMPDADALIVFSCIGRLGSLGPMASEEIAGLAATWNKPMIGFFSLGEFGKLQGSHCEFHGTTVSWLALKEK